MITRICILFLSFFAGSSHGYSQKNGFDMIELSYWHWATGSTNGVHSKTALHSSALHLSYTRCFRPITEQLGLGLGLGYFMTEVSSEGNRGVWFGDRNGFSIFSSLVFQGREKTISPVANLRAGYLRTHIWHSEVQGAGTYLLQLSGGARHRLADRSFISLSLGAAASRDTWFIPLSLGFSW
jgi:hypothetical protein